MATVTVRFSQSATFHPPSSQRSCAGFLFASLMAVAMVGCAASDKSARTTATPSVATPPVEDGADVKQADVQASLSFAYEDRLTDETIFLDWIDVKVDGEAFAEAQGKDFAPGPHKMQVEARFGKVGDDAGIVFKKNIVVVVQPSRSASVHLVVREVAATKLAAQVEPELVVKVYDQSSTHTAAVPWPKGGPPPKERKLVPIGLPPQAKLMDNKFNMVQVCVTETGAVDFLTLIKPLHPSFDAAVLDRISRGVFNPMVKDGNPIPFCYVQKNVARQA